MNFDGSCRISDIHFIHTGDQNCIEVKQGNIMFQKCDIGIHILYIDNTNISDGGLAGVKTSGNSNLVLLKCKVHAAIQSGVSLTNKSFGK